MATVTGKGQITLPREVRQALGVDTGAEVEFEVSATGVTIRKKVNREAFVTWSGYLKSRGIEATTDELMTDIRGQ